MGRRAPAHAGLLGEEVVPSAMEEWQAFSLRQMKVGFIFQKPGSILTPSPRTLWGLLIHSFSKNKLKKPSTNPCNPCQGLVRVNSLDWGLLWGREGCGLSVCLAPSSGLATGLRK